MVLAYEGPYSPPLMDHHICCFLGEIFFALFRVRGLALSIGKVLSFHSEICLQPEYQISRRSRSPKNDIDLKRAL